MLQARGKGVYQMTTPVNKKEGGGQVKNNQNPVQVVNIFHELYSILAIV